MQTRWKSVVGGGVAAATIAIAAIAVAGALPAAATTPPPTVPPEPSAPTSSDDDRTITVTARGTVQVDPDIAIVNLGVQANAATGAEAMDQVNTDAAALTEALVAAGIAEEDIQTSNLSLFTTTDDRGEITGYQASLNVDVTVRDIDAVGPTIDAAQQAAGEGFTIGGVSFSFDDPESMLEQARVDAVNLARSKAEQYALAAGVSLGDVVSITEQSASVPVARASADMAVTAEAAGPPISPGQLDLTVDVIVTYSITS